MSEKELEKMYTDYLENCESAPDRVRETYSAIYDAFDEYLEALQEFIFKSTVRYVLSNAANIETRKAV